jgi:hypothetical protein
VRDTEKALTRYHECLAHWCTFIGVPELRIVIATRRVDPRMGNTSYRLVHIMRGDPPSQLFEVPGQFTVRDQPPFPPPPGTR